MDNILKHHFENLYWMPLKDVTINSKKRTIDGYEVNLDHNTHEYTTDDTIEVSFEELFDALFDMMVVI